jgi:dATP pyrophosphohydrolase
VSVPRIVSRIVEVVVFRFGAAGPEFLLLQRAADEPVYPGVWQVVTGTVHDGESALDAARRELGEETRLGPERFWVVPHVSTFYEPRADELHQCPFFAAQVPPRAEPVLSAEHQEYRWLALPEALRLLLWPSQREGLRIAEQYVIRGEAAAAWLSVPPVSS